jgi:hypothetical protein
MWAQIIGAALGLWLMAAPDMLGYGGIAADNDHVVGPLAVSFAVIAIWQVTRPARWLNLFLGAWLVIAPWVLGHERGALINSMITGLLLMAFAAVRGKAEAHRYGGGWSVLWSSRDRTDTAARTR